MRTGRVDSTSENWMTEPTTRQILCYRIDIVLSFFLFSSLSFFLSLFDESPNARKKQVKIKRGKITKRGWKVEEEEKEEEEEKGRKIFDIAYDS